MLSHGLNSSSLFGFLCPFLFFFFFWCKRHSRVHLTTGSSTQTFHLFTCNINSFSPDTQPTLSETFNLPSPRYDRKTVLHCPFISIAGGLEDQAGGSAFKGTCTVYWRSLSWIFPLAPPLNKGDPIATGTCLQASVSGRYKIVFFTIQSHLLCCLPFPERGLQPHLWLEVVTQHYYRDRNFLLQIKRQNHVKRRPFCLSPLCPSPTSSWKVSQSLEVQEPW